MFGGGGGEDEFYTAPGFGDEFPDFQDDLQPQPEAVTIEDQNTISMASATTTPTMTATTTATTTMAISPPKRGRKKKDPNAPNGPTSAYAFFFREMQSTVKAHNPNAKFGEVSKIVASMWEALDDDSRMTYRKRNEEDKIRFKREMQAYRQGETAADFKEEQQKLDPAINAVFDSSTNLVKTHLVSQLVKQDIITKNICLRDGCQNNAVRNSEWEDEYCSNECVVAHCGNVFAEWVAEQIEAN